MPINGIVSHPNSSSSGIMLYTVYSHSRSRSSPPFPASLTLSLFLSFLYLFVCEVCLPLHILLFLNQTHGLSDHQTRAHKHIVHNLKIREQYAVSRVHLYTQYSTWYVPSSSSYYAHLHTKCTNVVLVHTVYPKSYGYNCILMKQKTQLLQ